VASARVWQANAETECLGIAALRLPAISRRGAHGRRAPAVVINRSAGRPVGTCVVGSAGCGCDAGDTAVGVATRPVGLGAWRAALSLDGSVVETSYCRRVVASCARCQQHESHDCRASSDAARRKLLVISFVTHIDCQEKRCASSVCLHDDNRRRSTRARIVDRVLVHTSEREALLAALVPRAKRHLRSVRSHLAGAVGVLKLRRGIHFRNESIRRRLLGRERARLERR
jgi:hypothetical protein